MPFKFTKILSNKLLGLFNKSESQQNKFNENLEIQSSSTAFNKQQLAAGAGIISYTLLFISGALDEPLRMIAGLLGLDLHRANAQIPHKTMEEAEISINNPQKIPSKEKRELKYNNSIPVYDKVLLSFVKEIEKEMDLLKLYFKNPENNKTQEQKALNKTLNFIVNDCFLNTSKELVKGLMTHHFPYNTYGLTFVFIGGLITASGAQHINHSGEIARGVMLASAGATYLALPNETIKNPVAGKLTAKFVKITENKLQTMDGKIGKKIFHQINSFAKVIDGYVKSVATTPKKIAFDLANLSLIPAGIDASYQCLTSAGAEFFSGLAKLSHVACAVASNILSAQAQRKEKPASEQSISR